GDRHSTQRQQTHRDRGGMPAAGRQPAEERFLCQRRIEMKWLRVELPGKGNDLFFVELVRAAGETLTDLHVVEKQQTLGISIRVFHSFARFHNLVPQAPPGNILTAGSACAEVWKTRCSLRCSRGRASGLWVPRQSLGTRLKLLLQQPLRLEPL